MTLVQALVIGLLIGSVYGLFSVGLTLAFGVLQVVNFAHGEFVMVGMYLAYSLSLWLHISPYAVIPVVIAGTAGIGAALYYVCFRGERRGAAGHDQLIASLGLSIVLQNVALAVYGSDPRDVHAATETWHLGSLYLPEGQVIACVVAIALTAGVEYVLAATKLGRGVRAIVADREVARLMGIQVDRLFLLAFVASVGLAGIAGAVLVVSYPTTPTVGGGFILIAFICVIMGGAGDVTGAFVAGLVVGIAQTLTATYIATAVQDLIVYAVFIAIAMLRPQGLLGRATA